MPGSGFEQGLEDESVHQLYFEEMLTGVTCLQVPPVKTASPLGSKKAAASPRLGTRPSSPRACKSPKSPGLPPMEIDLPCLLGLYRDSNGLQIVSYHDLQYCCIDCTKEHLLIAIPQ